VRRRRAKSIASQPSQPSPPLSAGAMHCRVVAVLVSFVHTTSCCAAAPQVKVESVVLLGHSPATRFDPVAVSWPAASADDAIVLCAANGTLRLSTSGGRSFESREMIVGGLTESPIGHDDTLRTIRGSGVPQGYLVAPTAGPWATQTVWFYHVDRVAKNVAVHTDTATRSQAHWEAPPYEVIMFNLGSGGVTALDSSGLNYLATAAVRYGTEELPGPTHRGHCCNNTVLVYRTSDGGRHWKYHSTIASKQSINAAGFPSQEGPNENDLVLLPDNKTLFCVIRRDGGDGWPNHTHVPYLFARSVDMGRTWRITEAPTDMLSARPRMRLLSGGALVVSGGRPALNMWVSLDSGAHFTKFDIPTLHNTHMPNPEDRFCPGFENATQRLGWAESSCYTQVLALSPDRVLICYERQGAGSGGYHPQGGKQPAGCNPNGSSVYCMRVQIKTNDNLRS
jgi:hypothetical protein